MGQIAAYYCEVATDANVGKLKGKRSNQLRVH